MIQALRLALLVAVMHMLASAAHAQSRNEQDIARDLEQRGFRIVKVRNYGLVYKFTVCQGNREFTMFVNTDGSISLKRPRGACPLGPADTADARRPRPAAPDPASGATAVEGPLDESLLMRIARRDGLQQVEITKPNPIYEVEGCREANRYRLAIDQRGRIRSREDIGACRTRLDREEITAILQQQGFYEIDVVDDRRAPFYAEACRGADRVEVLLGRRGQILEAERIGDCRRPLTREQIVAALEQEGFFKIELTEQQSGWNATVCDDAERVSLRLAPTGETALRRVVGECESQTVLDVLRTLEGRGAERTELVVVGCFRGVRYNWRFNRLGERTGRESAGTCD